MNKKEENIDYGNWVSKKLLYGCALLGLVFLGFSFLLPYLLIPALFFLVALVYFLYAREKFSPDGGNLQNRIRDLVLVHLDWDGSGQALDIGCGNGPLVIKLAEEYPRAKVTGIDYWGPGWDYSKQDCEKNAALEGVADHVTFKKASASSLPFEDGTFDAAVSNFVFHEVADTKNKRDLIREALRVVKEGGAFSFQDLFLVKKIYGEPDGLLAEIRGWGVADVKMARTNELDFIPAALKLPFMVGNIAIIYGKK